MNRLSVIAAVLILLTAAPARISQAARARTVEVTPKTTFALPGDWRIQGQPAAIKSYPNFDTIKDSIRTVALRDNEVLFIMAQPTQGRSLMQIAQAYELLLQEKALAAEDVNVYRMNYVLLPCEKCRGKNRLAHLAAATGRGAALGSTEYYRNLPVNHVSLSFVNGPWLVTIVYFAPGHTPELPAPIKPIINTLVLRQFEDPRAVIFKELIKYVPKGTAPPCAAAMSEMAAVSATEYKTIDIPALYASKKIPDLLKDNYAAAACECYKIKNACKRKDSVKKTD